jgi:misacylated tRNA(Ala) deacylase
MPRHAAQYGESVTELLYLTDAYATDFSAVVQAVEVVKEEDGPHNGAVKVKLDRTLFYPTGGGQPHDTGMLNNIAVVNVTKDGADAWHHLAPGSTVPSVGDTMHGQLDWDRRHELMRTHTALHVLCGVIWNRWQVPVTGGNMEPLAARMDFAFDPLPDGFAAEIELLVNAELAADRSIEVSFLPHAAAQTDPDLIRTKVNLIPASVTEIRIVDIVGLDKQADGGTHVRSTAEVGRIVVEKTESKGKGNKRLRVRVVDAVRQ